LAGSCRFPSCVSLHCVDFRNIRMLSFSRKRHWSRKRDWQYKNYISLSEPAISHHSHHVSLVQWTSFLFAPRLKGPRFKSPGGYLFETRIPLLALSRYKFLVSLNLQNVALNSDRIFEFTRSWTRYVPLGGTVDFY
jgi:hypothetical protein